MLETKLFNSKIMKKVLIAALVLVGATTMTSCKKEFTCECVGTTLTTYEKTGKGKNATDACNDAAEKVLGIPVETCVPK